MILQFTIQNILVFLFGRLQMIAVLCYQGMFSLLFLCELFICLIISVGCSNTKVKC